MRLQRVATTCYNMGVAVFVTRVLQAWTEEPGHVLYARCYPARSGKLEGGREPLPAENTTWLSWRVTQGFVNVRFSRWALACLD